MADYDFTKIEPHWQAYWKEQKINEVQIDNTKPKFYVLDMFPYPSGAGLHVGHPLGYIASDIFSRFKKLKGFNVLHPMGFDAFGLPAEQYAIQTGQHPALTTDNNIRRYKEQLFKIGFGYDWSREVRTCDPAYYKWTQWTFIQLFNHWFNNESNKAEPVEKLIAHFEKQGTIDLYAASSKDLQFTSAQWNSKNEKEKQEILMNYRLAYQADTLVNWCPALGTVLANDEVKDGYSARGNHPVIQKSMTQWLLRVSAYAKRLLYGLDALSWSDSLKEMQRNWIGKSTGAEIWFQIEGSDDRILVFTTRPDTIFGSTFMVLAPEHSLVERITTTECKNDIDQYFKRVIKRTERERIADTGQVTGEFTGAYAIHPFSGEKMKIFIADYVLLPYGTGAIMAVPAHDSRDYNFARHFNLPIKEVVAGGYIAKEAFEAKDGILINSDFLNGLKVQDAIVKMIEKLEGKGIGTGKTNFRIRDAIFSRQRYWGEPFPVYYKDGIPCMLDEKELPLELPEVDKFLPTETGEPPLGRAKNWKTQEGYPLEKDTMPGFAGSSGYYLRYMDPHNKENYFSPETVKYWRNVDLYIGGTEHATGHLIYARFWNKFLFDLGHSVEDEPFRKLVNQGMIQGRSNFVYRINIEKYAEHLLWDKIKDKKLGYDFNKNFRDGHRKFDFYCKESKVVLEIKAYQKLEKLESRYEEYFKSTDYKPLLIPLYQIIYNIEEVVTRIEDLLQGKEVKSFLHGDHKELKPVFVSKNLPGREQFSSELHVDVNIVENDILDIEAFKKWRPEFAEAEFKLEEGKYVCGYGIEKMSKSMFNVVNPDDIITKYGADTFRMYEMFLGPISDHKPWNTDGIEGVHKFLKKTWNLFFDSDGNFYTSNIEADNQELKLLHKTIKKVEEDIEKLAFNTSVSTFMITVNELQKINCNKKEILEPLLVLLSPFAPHISEELWHLAGHHTSITSASFPQFDPKYIVEDEYDYPVSVNGKLRTKIRFSLTLTKEEIEAAVLKNEIIQKWIIDKTIRKIIFVPKKIINIVVS